MRETVASLIRNPGAAKWEIWLTLLRHALADEESWMEAIESLSVRDQFGLLDALNTDASIYSDALRIITARHAEQIRDVQVRDYLLTDASKATVRFTNRLQQHRDELAELILRAETRREADFDLATADHQPNRRDSDRVHRPWGGPGVVDPGRRRRPYRGGCSPAGLSSATGGRAPQPWNHGSSASSVALNGSTAHRCGHSHASQLRGLMSGARTGGHS